MIARLLCLCALSCFSIIACADRPGWPAVLAALEEIPEGAHAAVLVIDLADERALFSHGIGQPMRMASLAKLAVSATALDLLGADYQFTTTLTAAGPIRDGSIDDLFVIGGGSPCLDEHFSAIPPEKRGDPLRIFRAWSQALKERGLRRIRGDLVVDGSLFSGPNRPSTYPQDQLHKWYAAPSSAFAFNDNCVDVRVVPTDIGQPARVDFRPRSPRITVVNKTVTVAGDDSRPPLIFHRQPGADHLTVSGDYHRQTFWNSVAIHRDPDLIGADQLATILRANGITIDGTVRRGRAPVDGEILHRQQDPLVPAITILNTRSQNFYGEQMLRVLGSRGDGDGSIAAGREVLAEQMAVMAPFSHREATIVDGSGLSYENVAPARFFGELLLYMHHHPASEAYHDSLKERWSGRVRGKVKTGTLSVARCLAGYLQPPGDRERIAFVIMLDRGAADSFGWARALRDKLFKMIAANVE